MGRRCYYCTVGWLVQTLTGSKSIHGWNVLLDGGDHRPDTIHESCISTTGSCTGSGGASASKSISRRHVLDSWISVPTRISLLATATVINPLSSTSAAAIAIMNPAIAETEASTRFSSSTTSSSPVISATATALPPSLSSRQFRIVPDSSPSLSPQLTALNEDEFYEELARHTRSGTLWLGEHHNSFPDHRLQASLIQTLAHSRSRRRNNNNNNNKNDLNDLAIGLEQVEVQFQPVLDAFLRGHVSITELPTLVEWDQRWMWPFAKYQAIFELARELHIPLLALNVNSEDLKVVEASGLPGLSRERITQYIPDAAGFGRLASEPGFSSYVRYVIEPSYELHRDLGLLNTTTTGEKLPLEMSFRNFFSCRILWDEAMAAKSFEWTQAHPSGLLIGLVGADHVKFRSGIPGRYARMASSSSSSASSCCVSVLLNPTLIDTRPPGSVSVQDIPQADSARYPERLTLQLRYVKDNVPVDSADQFLPASTGGVLPLADYIMIGE